MTRTPSTDGPRRSGPTDEVVERIVYLPRQCPSTGTGVLSWASGLYFGGTSTTPQTITGWISESA